MGGLDGARDDVREQRLKNEVVVAVDEEHLDGVLDGDSGRDRRCSRFSRRVSSCAALTPANPPPRTTMRFDIAGEPRVSPVTSPSQPNVKQYASTPASRNSISNRRSAIGPGWRISWYVRCSLTSRCRRRPRRSRARRPRLGAVEEDPERDGGAPGRRSHDEVDIAGVELEGDPTAGLVRASRHAAATVHFPASAQALRGSRVGRGVAVGSSKRATSSEQSRCSGGSRRTSRATQRPPVGGHFEPAGSTITRSWSTPCAPASSRSCWITISVLAYSPSPKWW